MFWPSIAWSDTTAVDASANSRGVGIPPHEWESLDGPKIDPSIPRTVSRRSPVTGDWRPFLFPHLTARQNLSELADLLYGDAGVAFGQSLDTMSTSGLLSHFSASTLIEAIRRATLVRDRHAVSVARASIIQLALIAAALLRDAVAYVEEDASVVDLIASVESLARGEVTSLTLRPDGSPTVPTPIPLPQAAGGEPGSSARNLEAWFGFVMAGQSIGLRCAAATGALGFVSDFRVTRSGTWHSFHVPPSRGGTGAPIVLVHGLFTHASSMLPLAIVLAAHTGRAVYAPDLLDFDFGFSRTHGRSGDAPAASSVSPLRLSDHVGALAEYVETLVRPGAPIDLVGHSFGGWCSHRLSLQRPELVRRLVLLSPGGGARYRFAPSLAMIAGPAVTARVLKGHVATPLVPLVSRVIDVIVNSPFHFRLLQSMEYDVFGGPPPHPASHIPTLVAWGTDDTLHRPWKRDRLDAAVDSTRSTSAGSSEQSSKPPSATSTVDIEPFR